MTETPGEWFRARLEEEIPHLRRYARALAWDGEEADDLVQACLERALARAHQWDPGRRLRPWLFRIQHNLHVSRIRRRDLERRSAWRQEASETVPANHEVSLELRTVQRAMALLPEVQRDVIVLVAVEGMSYEEASEVLAVPVGTVRSRLSRAREALRVAMLQPVARVVAGDAE